MSHDLLVCLLCTGSTQLLIYFENMSTLQTGGHSCAAVLAVALYVLMQLLATLRLQSVDRQHIICGLQVA